MSDLDMMRRVAVIEAGSFSCCRSRRCHRSFRRNWLALVTDVDVQAARALIDSMTNEGLVRATTHQTCRQVQPDGVRRRSIASAPTNARKRGNAW